jgi:hypothetical protein
MRHVVSLVAVVPVVYTLTIKASVVAVEELLLLHQDQDLCANSIITL